MKFFITLTLLALVRSVFAQSVQFGLLVCEQGPVIYRQTSQPGVSFQIEPPSTSQCTPGQAVCNQDLGVVPQHGDLTMCSVSRNCLPSQQVCLRRLSAGSTSIIGCCKVGFEAWALSGIQKTSGSQNPPAQQLVRMTVPTTESVRIASPSQGAVHMAAPSTIPVRIASPSQEAVHIASPNEIPVRMAAPSQGAVHMAAPSTPPVRIASPSQEAVRIVAPAPSCC